MNGDCLTQEQLAHVSLGTDVDASHLQHVEDCPACRSELARLRTMTDQLAAIHNKVSGRHGESRARLLAELTPTERPARPSIINHVTHWLGGLTMTQRIVLGSVSTGAVLGVLLVALAGPPRSAIAMAQMAEQIQRARSYQATLIQEMEYVPKEGQPAVTAEIKGTISWLAPRSYRMKLKGNEGNLDTIDVSPAGKPGISIDHIQKSYERKPVQAGRQSPFITMLDRLGRFSGKADRELGTKDIDGATAAGFVLDAKKIDPDMSPGPVEVWIDAESKLPVRIRYEMQTEGIEVVVRWEEFVWNSELAPKLFDTTPPEGYTDATPEPPKLEKQVAQICEAFALYAKLSGGHYPRVRMVYGDVTRDEMRKMAGFKGQPTAEDFRDETFQKIVDATSGLARINVILRNNPDAAYHGIEVGPQEKQKVLLRWRLEDGRYHVIYGDLHDETVSAERLRELEE